MASPTRRERDLLGEREVPARALWGIHTLRAVENFPISATPISIYPDLIVALASIKLAAAKTNCELKLLDQTLVSGIGNIYADEGLWRARLHYARPTATLRPLAGSHSSGALSVTRKPAVKSSTASVWLDTK